MSDQVMPGPSGPDAGNEARQRTAPGGSARRGSYGGAGSYGDGTYGGYDEREGAAENHLVEYVRTVYKHRWLALTAFAVVFVSAAISTFSETPIYEARVQLLIEPENRSVMSLQQAADPYYVGYDDYYYQTRYSVLKSRGLARRTIEALKLSESPEFGGGAARVPRKRSFSITGTVAGAIGWMRSLVSPAPPKAPDASASGETARQSGIVDAFLGRLTVSPVANSRLVFISIASPNPEMAAKLANAHASQYIEQNLQSRFLSTKEASDWLAEQLATERKRLEESELALQKYRETGNAVALEDQQNIVVQRLTDLNAAYTKARTERIEKEALYSQLKGLQNDQSALDSFPAILSNTFIQQLKTQLTDLLRQQAQSPFGEKHPEMVKLTSAIQSAEARLAGEIAKVVQSVRNEFLSAEAQERSLASALEAQKGDALALNRTGIEYGVLRREAESNRQIYDALMQRSKETGITGELKTSNIRIVDEAEVPRGPVRPNTSRDLMLGLLGGLVAGIGLAFFVDYLDNRIKNPDEIKHFLGLSFLGLVPGLADKEVGKGQSPILTEVLPQNFAEAFRVIRTNVLFSTAEEGARSVLVTSTQPREGKTVVAANLAIALAQSGQRILLLDADMRKPRQHNLMKLSQSPGLSSLLVGKAKANDTVQKSAVGNLWVLPAGPAPPNPAELLGSIRFKELMKSLGQHFEWIVVDSPPVMAVTDASVIAHHTTGVVFVIGSEQVNRYATRTAVEQLRGSKATILGAVLNRVNIRRNPYYYARYYKHDYAEYYSTGTTT